MYQSLFIISFLLLSVCSFSQQKYFDYGFERDNSIIVKDENSKILKYPWAGGMNSCQFSPIDLNADGIKDLFVFDVIGNRIMTFLNNGIKNTSDYKFAPEYTKYFPHLHDWAILIDYNNDGKEDIFTFENSCIKVYKNISSDSLPEFNLITSQLKAVQYGDTVPVFTSPINMPAISDLDSDGDLDLLAFFPLGSFVYQFRNYSVELFNNTDSLFFKQEKACWGNFAVSSTDDKVTLNINCPWKCNNTKKIEHIGNTLLAIDTKGNGVKDLLLGDYDFTDLNLLINGGTKDSAFIIAQDTNFPSNSRPVNIFSFPAAYYLDLDNDSLNDLVVSPFESRADISENINNAWFYKNTGNKQKPNFNFVKSDFLQDEMQDYGAGAYPVTFDYNSDGLMDLVISNFGYRDSSWYVFGSLKSAFNSSLALLENVGSKDKAEYKIINRDYAEISKLNIAAAYPAFSDINNDGKIEMILGNADGSFFYFDNIAPLNETPEFVLTQRNYLNLNTGGFSTPQLIDINGDSLIDLISGNQMGTIYYYQNTGTKENPHFTLISDNFGNVNVTNTQQSYYGYSIPFFFRDKNNKLRLITGSESGFIYYYKDIEENLNSSFTLESKLAIKDNDFISPINDGLRTSAVMLNLDNDKFPDLISGNFAGGLCLYKGIIPFPDNTLVENNSLPDFKIYPNPAFNYVNISLINLQNKPYNLTISDLTGRIIYNSFNQKQTSISIDISSFAKGIYFLNIQIKNTIPLTKKIILK